MPQIGEWPNNPLQVVKGYNDTYNSYQAANRGRNVTRAEWEAARDDLWRRCREASRAQEMASRVKELANRARQLEGAHANSGTSAKGRNRGPPKCGDWPTDPLEAQAGVNDTYNAYQAMNRGRNVSRAEWEQAKSSLWRRHHEETARRTQFQMVMAGAGAAVGGEGGDGATMAVQVTLAPEAIEPQDGRERAAVDCIHDAVMKEVMLPVVYEAIRETKLDAEQVNLYANPAGVFASPLNRKGRGSGVGLGGGGDGGAQSPAKRPRRSGGGGGKEQGSAEKAKPGSDKVPVLGEKAIDKWKTGYCRQLLEVACSAANSYGYDKAQGEEDEGNVAAAFKASRTYGIDRQIIQRHLHETLFNQPPAGSSEPVSIVAVPVTASSATAVQVTAEPVVEKVDEARELVLQGTALVKENEAVQESAVVQEKVAVPASVVAQDTPMAEQKAAAQEASALVPENPVLQDKAAAPEKPVAQNRPVAPESAVVPESATAEAEKKAEGQESAVAQEKGAVPESAVRESAGPESAGPESAVQECAEAKESAALAAQESAVPLVQQSAAAPKEAEKKAEEPPKVPPTASTPAQPPAPQASEEPEAKDG